MKQKDERKNANHELNKGGRQSWLLSRVGEGGQGCILIWSEDGVKYPLIERNTEPRSLPPALPTHKRQA